MKSEGCFLSNSEKAMSKSGFNFPFKLCWTGTQTTEICHSSSCQCLKTGENMWKLQCVVFWVGDFFFSCWDGFNWHAAHGCVPHSWSSSWLFVSWCLQSLKQWYIHFWLWHCNARLHFLIVVSLMSLCSLISFFPCYSFIQKTKRFIQSSDEAFIIF